jgi:site-specific DNA recombinase
VRGDRLEQTVWDQVRALLEEPNRVAEEYRRRISQAKDAPAPSEEIARIERQMTALERGIERLIDIYTSGLIEKAEFEPRITGQRQRLEQLSEHKRVAVEAVESERELSLVISQLEEFSARVAQGLGELDWLGRREIIHTRSCACPTKHRSDAGANDYRRLSKISNG